MHGSTDAFSRRALVQARRVLLFLLLWGAPLRAEPPAWFHLRPEVSAEWTAVADVARGDRVRLHHVQDPSLGGQSILVLFTKSSSAYDIALSKLLSVFEDKRMRAVFTLQLLDEAQETRPPAGPLPFEPERYALIFTMGSDATTYAFHHLRHLSVPIVSVCAKDPLLLLGIPASDFEAVRPANMAFTSLDLPAEAHLVYLRELLGELETLVLLYDRHNTSAVRTQVEPMRRVAAAQHVRVLEVGVERSEQAREELERALPEVLAQLGRERTGPGGQVFWVTGSTAVFQEIDVIQRLARDVPVVSVAAEVVRPGDASAVMSIGVGFESNAHLAALYGVELLLGGVKPNALKVGVVSPPDIAINFRKARRIGLSIPFGFLEAASSVYGYDGQLVRKQGQDLKAPAGTPSGAAH